LEQRRASDVGSGAGSSDGVGDWGGSGFGGYGYINTPFSLTIRYVDTFKYFSKNNTVHARYRIKENKQQYSMGTHFKGFKRDP
jgi:hypothetical protein